jgi:hypothetical protein
MLLECFVVETQARSRGPQTSKFLLQKLSLLSAFGMSPLTDRSIVCTMVPMKRALAELCHIRGS